MLYPIQNNVRNKLDISGIWDFKCDPDLVGEKEGWANGLTGARPMAVPGSWNESYMDLFGYLDLAWYVKRTYVPKSWRGERVFIRVGSANYFGTVYVNGVKVGSHEGGHLPFAFEINDQIKWGEENVIAISVENVLRPDRVPSGDMPTKTAFDTLSSTPRTTFDFYPFSGLQRPVVLYSVPQTYIEDVTVVTTLEPEAKVRVTVKLNSAADGKGSVQLQGGDDIFEAGLAFQDGRAEAELTVPNADLWSDKDPYLYDLTVQSEGNGQSDQYGLKVGIRTIAVDGGKILLNGKPVKLNGFGRHEDFPASGKGLNIPLIVKDYQLMKWVGANAYRTSHYPYSEEEMQMADREGFLIIDEIPAVSLQMSDTIRFPERLRMCLQQIDEMIARDKNHPAVVMWCVANEPMPGGLSVGASGGGGYDPAYEEANLPGKQFLDTELARARELDPTRLVTIVTVGGGPQNWMEQCDVICMNRYHGWYSLGGQLDKARRALEGELDQVWDRFHKPIIMTEFGADTVPGYHGLPDVMWTEEYQAEYIRFHMEVAAARDFVAGMQVWNFADFAAVQGLMRVGGLNHKGVFTRVRTPKMAAHVLREFWVQ